MDKNNTEQETSENSVFNLKMGADGLHKQNSFIVYMYLGYVTECGRQSMYSFDIVCVSI